MIDSCRNFIHTCVKGKKTGHIVDMTFVYGNPLFSQRRQLWGKLENLILSQNGGPQCSIGDFNERNSITEKGGSRPVAPIRLTLLRDFLNSTSINGSGSPR